jgi:phosphoribosylformylglycinamidine (FGAM) synthase-like enzyme
LVRACRGLREACLAYGLPLVSGKDSMKNDARVDGRKISVRPTLLVTLLGAVENVQKTVSTDFLDAGDLIYILGETNGELGCTFFERLFPACQFGAAPDVDLAKARQLYHALARAISGRIVRSCHDCSDGGLAVAVAESCLGGRLGARLQLSHLPGRLAGYPANEYAARALFSESGGRFVVSVRRDDRERFEDTLSGCTWRFTGEVTQGDKLELVVGTETVLAVGLSEIEMAFKTPIL